MKKFHAKAENQNGMSNLLVLLGLMLIMAGGSLYVGNFKASQRSEDSIDSAISQENGERFVMQMIADDELCTVTDFMKDLKNYQLVGELTAPVQLKKQDAFVDYSQIGVDKLKWPTNGWKDAPNVWGRLFGSRTPVTGKGASVGLVFEQPKASERPVVVTKLASRTITRVPVDVYQHGTINGQAAFFNPTETYIEFDSTAPDPNTPVACYHKVSSRSLCLDRKGFYDPKAPLKCIFGA